MRQYERADCKGLSKEKFKGYNTEIIQKVSVINRSTKKPFQRVRDFFKPLRDQIKWRNLEEAPFYNILRNEYLSDVAVGKELEICSINVPANMGGRCDPVLGFGDPDDKEMKWLTYGSKVKLNGENYTVIRGELSDYASRAFTLDQSVYCLEPESGDQLESMDDYRGNFVKVVEVNEDVDDIIKFDLKHQKFFRANTSHLWPRGKR